MRIAILGAGNIGGALGRKWVQAGHSIRYGVRDPNKPDVQTLVNDLGENASAARVGEAISSAEVVVFAIPGVALVETVALHAAALDGRIIIDATNNIRAETINNIDVFAERTPNASVYRAFNNYGWEIFANPMFDDSAADLFYCGTDGAARAVVDGLIADVGLRPIYLGGLDKVGLVDDILWLWFALAREQNMGRRLAFKVLTRE